MKKKFFYLLFIFCLVKLYHIAYISLQFSPNLLINSFNKNVGAEISLGRTGEDVIPLKKFFSNKNISEFNLSSEILKNSEIYYQRIIEFTYPIKMNQKSNILVTHKNEDKQENCNLLHKTKNFHIYEC
tara:strand:+ start:1090 stop:1473 length:384 start_codon:yes stop_codon:yes gene_type:complete